MNERRALHAGDEVLQHGDVLPHRRCQDDEVGAIREREVLAAVVGHTQASSGLDDAWAIDRDQPARRPRRAQGQRDRATDQAAADYRDTVKHAASVNPYVPHPRRLTCSRQMLRPIAGAMILSSAIRRSNCAG